MVLAVYVPISPASNFIVETFFPLFEHESLQKTILIAENVINLPLELRKTETLIIEPQPRNPLLKKLWIE